MEPDPIDAAISAYSEAMQVMEPIRMQVWEERQLTVSQLRLTYLIRDQQNPSLGDLAERLGITGATMSGLVDRLVRRGIVERMQDSSDRRVVRVRLTEEGEQLSRELQSTGRAFLRHVFGAMGAEASAETAHALEKFVKAVSDAYLDGTYGRILHDETVKPAKR